MICRCVISLPSSLLSVMAFYLDVLMMMVSSFVGVDVGDLQ